MAKKVASLYVKFDSESAALLNDMRKIATQAKRMGNRVDREANRIKYAFNKIRRAAQVVASAFIFVAGIRQLGKLVTSMAKAEDGVKLLDARFKQFARAGDSFTRVYNLSKELGVSLDETAGGMTRLLVATKSIGTAQSTLEDVYKNIVLLGRAGGTSTEEMIGGMRQLSQGLASGRLQGEELRSVLENLPLVAMEIAKEMGIGIGQIRKAAAEGKITGEVVIDALSNIGIKMEDLPTTWAMQTENLRTEWGLFLADLSKAVDEVGLLSSLVAAVQFVRFEMLGSFRGVSTEDLRAMQAERKKQVDLINNTELSQSVGGLGFNQAAAMSGLPLPSNPLQGVKDAAKTFADLLSTNALMGESAETVRETYRKINEELERRNALDEIAAKAGEARAAIVSQDKVDQSAKKLQARADQLRNSIKSDMQKFFELVAEMEELVAKTDLTAAQARMIIDAKYDAIMDKAREATKEEMDLLDQAEKKAKDVFDEMASYADQAARNIQDAFADFFFDPFDKGLKGMVEGFLTALRTMLANQLALKTMLGLTGFFGGLSGGGASGGGVPKMAAGGLIGAGQIALVGEQGPELFAPGTSGMIIPNHKLGGGGSVNNYYFEAGADIATIEARIVPMLERAESNSVQKVLQMRGEGRL